MNIIAELEKEQIKAITAKRLVPDFQAGDTVKVMVKVIEGTTQRLQAYEGVVIARSARLNENFTVRRSPTVRASNASSDIFSVHR